MTQNLGVKKFKKLYCFSKNEYLQHRTLKKPTNGECRTSTAEHGNEFIKHRIRRSSHEPRISNIEFAKSILKP